MTLVFDAGALVAYLDGEAGAEMVRQLLRDNPGQCYAHAVQLCEVYYPLLRIEGATVAQQAIAILALAGIQSSGLRGEAMTLTLELDPTTEAQIAAGAAASGRSVTAYAAQLLTQAAEDAADIAECDRRMDEAKSEDWIPWEQVKAEAGL